jgi:hypothetical protein
MSHPAAEIALRDGADAVGAGVNVAHQSTSRNFGRFAAIAALRS